MKAEIDPNSTIKALTKTLELVRDARNQLVSIFPATLPSTDEESETATALSETIRSLEAIYHRIDIEAHWARGESENYESAEFAWHDQRPIGSAPQGETHAH
jgi:hypothetical protein